MLGVAGDHARRRAPAPLNEVLRIAAAPGVAPTAKCGYCKTVGGHKPYLSPDTP
jgi:hypothetical protein